MQRHFTWHRNILFANELHEAGSKSLVILSGADGIVPSEIVRSHIEDYNNALLLDSSTEEVRIETLYLDGASHGGIIFEPRCQEMALNAISSLILSFKEEGQNDAEL